MKKFLSLFCALAIVLSASAAPVKKTRAAKFQRTAVEQLRTEKNITAKKAVEKKAFAAKEIKSQHVVEGKPLSTTDAAFRAPKAAAEVINVKCGSWDIEDWGTDGELTLYAEDNTYAFYFDLIYGGEAEDLVLGKTYTVEDIYVGSDGMYAGVFYEGEWHYGIKELSLVKTIDEKDLVHFVGSCTDSLDAAFTFYYDEPEFIPTGDTVKYNFTTKAKMTYSSYFADWSIKADDGKYAFALDILSEDSLSAVGNYSSDNKDFDLSYTWVEVYATKDSSNLYQAVKAKASIFVENDTTIILADILAEDGVVYQFGAFYAAPSKQGEATIEATNLKVEDAYLDWFGIVFVEASNEEYGVSLNLYPESANYLGDYTIGAGVADGEIIVLQDSITTSIYSGAISVANTNDGLALTGKVLCENNIEYTLNLTYVKPTKTREKSITITNGKLTIYESTGDWQVVGVNADSSMYVAIDILSDVIAGTYTEEDLDQNYTYVDSIFVRNDSLLIAEEFIPLTLNIVVTFNAADSTATIKGTYLGQGYLNATDVPEFTLDITAKVGVYVPSTESPYDAEEAFEVNFPVYEVNSSYVAQYGVLLVQAVDNNSNIIGLEIYLPDGATELAAGEYPVNDTYAPQTIGAGYIDGGLYGSFAGQMNEQGQILVPLWLIVEGTVTVTENGVITVDAKNTKGAAIKSVLGAAQGIENVDAKAAATKRIVNGQLLIEKNGRIYNVLGTAVK